MPICHIGADACVRSPKNNKFRCRVKVWDDFNNNNYVDEGERLGDIGKFINMSKFGISIGIYKRISDQVKYSLLDLDNRRIIENREGKGVCFFRNELTNGKYIIVADDNGNIFTRVFEVKNSD